MYSMHASECASMNGLLIEHSHESVIESLTLIWSSARTSKRLESWKLFVTARLAASMAKVRAPQTFLVSEFNEKGSGEREEEESVNTAN